MSENPDAQAEVWKSEDLVRTFLEGVRGGIPYAADQIAIMLRIVAGADIPVRRFLDLGSGAGTLAAALLTHFPGARAVLVDFSEPMLEAARPHFQNPPHQLIHADFGDPTWTATVQAMSPFDVIVSGYAIHHSPDERKKAIYQEIYELLVPGGIFVNIEHVRPGSSWVGALNDELFVESIFAHHQRIGTGKTRDQVATEFVYRPDKQANILAPLESQCDWLRAIGYVDVDCFFRIFELAVFGGRKP